MLRVVLVVVCAALAAGCGDGGESGGAGAGAGSLAPEPAAGSPPPAAGSPRPAPLPPPAAASSSSGSGILRGTYKRLNGEPVDLARYRGRVVLVVNTATECGYTPQLEGLEALYRARRDDGLVVLGFPANDFAGQEPRSDKDIATFCKANYGVTFPMFTKSSVVGDGASALYRRLTAQAGAPDWNFNKYLVDRRGRVVARYGAGTEPDAPALTARLGKLLAASARS